MLELFFGVEDGPAAMKNFGAKIEKEYNAYPCMSWDNNYAGLAAWALLAAGAFFPRRKK